MRVPFLFLFCILILAGCSRPYLDRNISPMMPVYVRPPPVTPMKKMIILDAGHGGKDSGCDQSEEDCLEKELALQAAFLVQEHLQKLGHRVCMTRTRDVFVALDERAEMANRLNGALFVSVHFNAAENIKAKGVEVYYCDTDANEHRVQSSQRLAKVILDKVIANTEAVSRGVKTANFRVIKKTHMPAVLVECGFLTHPEERARCKDPIYLNAIAWGIARGVDDYLREN